MFAKIVDGVVVSYPYNTRIDHPDTGFPKGSDYPTFNIYWVHNSSPPTPSEAQKAIESDPVFAEGQWVQGWSLIDKTAEEIRLEKYNPDDFLLTLNANANYQTWFMTLPSNPYANFLLSVQRASDSDNWVHAQAIYDQLKASFPHTFGSEFTAIAEQYGIPLTL